MPNSKAARSGCMHPGSPIRRWLSHFPMHFVSERVTSAELMPGVVVLGLAARCASFAPSTRT